MVRGLVIGLAGVAAAGAALFFLRDEERPTSQRGPKPVAVETASVTAGPIVRRRALGGALEPALRVVIATRVAGRLEALDVQLGDAVARGEVVARVDDRELRELARAARAEAEVSAARARQARAAARLAEQTLERRRELEGRGVGSAAQLDAAKAEARSAKSAAEVAAAEVDRAQARLQAARVRLDYAALRAGWRGEAKTVYVAERHAREGDALSVDDPVLTLVGLDPLVAVVSAAERDYRFLKPGLRASLQVDAFPGERFDASVRAFPPAFAPGDRQLRVELEVSNPEGRLAPGMFAEVAIELERVSGATIVPHAALTRRDESPGVFRVEGGRARWTPVQVGLRDGERLQILDPPLEGRVVTLGQRLLDDGTPVIVPEAPASAP